VQSPGTPAGTTLRSHLGRLRLPPKAPRTEGPPKIAGAPSDQAREAHPDAMAGIAGQQTGSNRRSEKREQARKNPNGSGVALRCDSGIYLHVS